VPGALCVYDGHLALRRFALVSVLVASVFAQAGPEYGHESEKTQCQGSIIDA